jgi:hypothetical protein
MRYADSHCDYVEAFKDDVHTYTFTGPCVVTGKPYSVTVLGSELYAYRKGAKLQDAFKSLSAGDREFLFSGFSPEGWAATFPDGEDEDEDEESPRFISTPHTLPNVFEAMLRDSTAQKPKCPLCEAGHPVGIMTVEHIRNGEVLETHIIQNKIVSDGVDSIINVDMSKVSSSITIDPTNPEA